MGVTRSIVCGVVAPCKTESSQKASSRSSNCLETLAKWREACRYTKPEDWVFASRQHRGRKPIWRQAILRKYIRPAAQRVGIQKQFGWHTFRHTYSILLRSVGTECPLNVPKFANPHSRQNVSKRAFFVPSIKCPRSCKCDGSLEVAVFKVRRPKANHPHS